jgi:hypothetical protein
MSILKAKYPTVYCLVIWVLFCKDRNEERLGLLSKQQCIWATSGQFKSNHLGLVQANQPLKVRLQLPPPVLLQLLIIIIAF